MRGSRLQNQRTLALKKVASLRGGGGASDRASLELKYAKVNQKNKKRKYHDCKMNRRSLAPRSYVLVETELHAEVYFCLNLAPRKGMYGWSFRPRSLKLFTGKFSFKAKTDLSNIRTLFHKIVRDMTDLHNIRDDIFPKIAPGIIKRLVLTTTSLKRYCLVYNDFFFFLQKTPNKSVANLLSCLIISKKSESIAEYYKVIMKNNLILDKATSSGSANKPDNFYFKSNKEYIKMSGKHAISPPQTTYNPEKRNKANDNVEDSDEDSLLKSDDEGDALRSLVNMEVDDDIEDSANGGKETPTVPKDGRKPSEYFEISAEELKSNATNTLTLPSSELLKVESALVKEKKKRTMAEIKERDLRCKLNDMEKSIAERDSIIESLLAKSQTEPINQNEQSHHSTVVTENTQEPATESQSEKEDNELWSLAPATQADELMIIRFKEYPTKVFNDDEFTELRSALDEAHAKAKTAFRNFKIIIDDVSLRQGAVAAHCKNIGTISWISHIVPIINSELTCERASRAIISPAFKLWAAGCNLSFDEVRDGIMSDEIDPSNWILLKILKQNPSIQQKPKGLEALFLGDEKLKDLVRRSNNRAIFVQYRFNGAKAKIVSLIGINETHPSDLGKHMRNSVIAAKCKVHFPKFQRTLHQLKRCWSRTKLTRLTRASSTPTSVTTEKTNQPQRGEKYEAIGRLNPLKLMNLINFLLWLHTCELLFELDCEDCFSVISCFNSLLENRKKTSKVHAEAMKSNLMSSSLGARNVNLIGEMKCNLVTKQLSVEMLNIINEIKETWLGKSEIKMIRNLLLKRKQTVRKAKLKVRAKKSQTTTDLNTNEKLYYRSSFTKIETNGTRKIEREWLHINAISPRRGENVRAK